MTIKISNGKVYFSTTLPSRRKSQMYIECSRNDGVPVINVPATGNIELWDIPEFVNAVLLAAKIANGELEIE